MELQEILKEYNIECFDCKDHDFIFVERFCACCFHGASDKKFNNLSDKTQSMIHHDTRCSKKNSHNFSNIFKCSK